MESVFNVSKNASLKEADLFKMRFEGLHGENSTIIRFAETPCNFSFVSKCGSEKNRRNSRLPKL